MNTTQVALTVKLDPLLDARLKHEALVANIAQEELLRRYVQVGLNTIDGKHRKGHSKK